MPWNVKTDLTGQRFGRLVVLEHIKRNDEYPNGGWLCRCDCGTQKVIPSNPLTSGRVKSCGCYNKTRLVGSHVNQTHGMSRTRLYTTWRNMRVRCYDPKDKRYPLYGGRGIVVCDEWRSSFIAFHDWAMANGYREDLTIDRIDTDGNYEPNNCRFITRAENNKNRRNWRKKL